MNDQDCHKHIHCNHESCQTSPLAQNQKYGSENFSNKNSERKKRRHSYIGQHIVDLAGAVKDFVHSVKQHKSANSEAKNQAPNIVFLVLKRIHDVIFTSFAK